MKLKRVSDKELRACLERHYKAASPRMIDDARYGSQSQLDSCQKQVDELVGEIFREIEKNRLG